MVQKKSRRKGKMSKSRKGSKRLVNQRKNRTRRYNKTRKYRTRKYKSQKRVKLLKQTKRKKSREKDSSIITMLRNRLKHIKRVQKKYKKQRGGAPWPDETHGADNLVNAVRLLSRALARAGAAPVVAYEPGPFNVYKLAKCVSLAIRVFSVLHRVLIQITTAITGREWNTPGTRFSAIIEAGIPRFDKAKLVGRAGSQRGALAGYYDTELAPLLDHINNMSLGLPIKYVKDVAPRHSGQWKLPVLPNIGYEKYKDCWEQAMAADLVGANRAYQNRQEGETPEMAAARAADAATHLNLNLNNWAENGNGQPDDTTYTDRPIPSPVYNDDTRVGGESDDWGKDGHAPDPVSDPDDIAAARAWIMDKKSLRIDMYNHLMANDQSTPASENSLLNEAKPILIWAIMLAGRDSTAQPADQDDAHIKKVNTINANCNSRTNTMDGIGELTHPVGDGDPVNANNWKTWMFESPPAIHDPPDQNGLFDKHFRYYIVNSEQSRNLLLDTPPKQALAPLASAVADRNRYVIYYNCIILCRMFANVVYKDMVALKLAFEYAWESDDYTRVRTNVNSEAFATDRHWVKKEHMAFPPDSETVVTSAENAYINQ